MCGGIGERIDDLHLFGDRTGPPVGNDQRQRIFVFGTYVNEMNVQSVDLGNELRQGVEFCLDLAPVVLCRPISSERLSRRELHALGCIGDRFSFRPPCVFDAPAQFGEFRLWNIYFLKRTNRTVGSCCGAVFSYSNSCVHGFLLCGDVGICKQCADRSWVEHGFVPESTQIPIAQLIGEYSAR